MLTTIDNPYSPYDEFDEWFAWDVAQGYNTCAYLARIAKSSNNLSPLDEELAIEEAIDEIVRLNINGMYKKVLKTEDQV